MGSMEVLLPVINKLQDVFAAMGAQPLDLPQIAVVGSQSAGKSSVLETLVGKDFLPRGHNIVTRRPLILQLLNTNQFTGDDKGKEWATFLHTKNEKWDDYRKIRAEIKRETERVAPEQSISPSPIRLCINSPTVLNLTIVDLPGMTKVPVGNQPKNIHEQIRKLILTYIKRKNCIILAVTPANTDLANSDALQMARTVDPEGNRTLGVITKIDLMDQGTNALDYLNGTVVPLKLGYVGVVNRSQQDIIDGKTNVEAALAEKQFFTSKKEYRSISDRCGSKFLGAQMCRILINHIRKVLPDIKEKIQKDVSKLEVELAGYGMPVMEGNQAKSALLLNLITQFSTNFSDSIEGIAIDKTKYASNELFGGARILRIFRVLFQKEILRIKPHDGLTDSQIRTALRNACGPHHCLFLPEVAFEVLVKEQIEKLRAPALNCIELVYAELQLLVRQSLSPHMVRFDNFVTEVEETVNAKLRERLTPVRVFMNNLIDLEIGYINKAHPLFISGSKALQSTIVKVKPKLKNVETQTDVKPDVEKKKKPHAEGSGWSLWGKKHHTGEKVKFSNRDKVARPQEKSKKVSSIKRRNSKSFTDREVVEVNLVRVLIECYFTIVKKSIVDAVPKAIMCLLVTKLQEKIQADLVYALYNESQFEHLLKENLETARLRGKCIELLKVLKKSVEIVNEVQDFKI